MKRREFLQVTAAGAALLAADSARGSATGEIPRRKLGKTGVEVSAMGLGGRLLGKLPDEAAAIQLISQAVDAGITFIDTAWEYSGGVSEQRLGKALAGKRDHVFLMSKVCTHGRDAKTAMQQLEQSLQRLRTDHLDLWQIHEVIYENDPELHFAKGGVVEALDLAKMQGKVRFTGFTGHKDPSIHLKMLSHDYPFDTVQMPLNPFDGQFRSFEQSVLPAVNRRGMAAIGMKSLGGDGQMVQRGAISAEEALRYAMSLPVATTVCGIDSPTVLAQNLSVARGFRPMSEAQMRALRERVAPYAVVGRFELYKTTLYFDEAEGRAQHGYPTIAQLPY